MQDIFQDFVLWLLKFLAVSTGLLTAARIWTLRHRRKGQKKLPTGQTPLSSLSKETRKSLLILASGIALLHGLVSGVYAQAKPAAETTFPLPIPYEEQSSGKAARPIPKVDLPRKLTQAEKAQLAKTRRIALRLSQEGDENFRRGLLPLGDHLRQLLLSYSLRQNLARLQGESLQSLNQEERQRNQGIVRQLENFNQPAAEGWAADLALARVYLARVDAESASLQGESGAMFAALSRQAESARLHVSLRGFDEALGMAPPQALVEAAQLERRANLEALPRDPSLAEYRTAFGAIALNSSAWNPKSSAGLARGRESAGWISCICCGLRSPRPMRF